MRLIDADSVLNGIEELKKSPWFNRGKEIVKGDPGFQHVGYIERKEAVEVVRDLCIREEPTVGGWISVSDKLPEEGQEVVIRIGEGNELVRFWNYRWVGEEEWFILDLPTHWMPLPKLPKEE